MLPKHLREPNPNLYLSNNYVTVDFETTNLDNGSPYDGNNRIILAVWKIGNDTVKVRRASEYQLAELVRDCERADFIIAHNAKFELGWLRRCGLDTTKCVVWCTQIAEYVRAGNRKWKLSLDSSLGRWELDSKESLVSKFIKNKVCPSEIPPRWLEEYCIVDVEQDHKLFLKQRQWIVENEMLGVVYTRCLLTPALVDIETQGVHLDQERVTHVYNKLNAELVELKNEYTTLMGNVNPKSPKQLANAIYNILGFSVPKDYRGNPILTGNGTPSTNGKVLEKLTAKTGQQRQFLVLQKRIAKLNAALSKAVGKFYECVTQTEEHILTATLNQTVTQTHRLSSTGKNYKAQFQNFPREFKPLITARYNGWKIGEADQAQLEFRAAAFLGQDKRAMQDILEGVDVHSYTASILTGAGQETDRQHAKTHTFKPLYGGTSGTTAERTYYAAFREKYPDIVAVQNRWIDEVLRTKALRTITGFKFYWEDTIITRSGFVVNSQSICNYPVQSFATADIVPIGVAYQWHLMKAFNMKSFLVNTIHDSTVCEVHPEEEELYKEIAVKSLVDLTIRYLKLVYNIDFNVPLAAEIKIAPYWNDSEKWRNEWLVQDKEEINDA